MNERRGEIADLSGGPFGAASSKMAEVLDGFRFCMIGGLAVACYANPPVTLDIDFLVDAGGDGLQEIRYRMNHEGWNTQPIWFPKTSLPGMPTRGVRAAGIIDPALPFEADVLATSGDEFLDSVILHAKRPPGIVVNVARAEDLIIMKMLTARDKDLRDVEDIKSALGGDLNDRYIARTLDWLGF